MTITKGVDWGQPGALPPQGRIVESDAEARQVVIEARQRGEQPVLGLLGGDLCRTVGGTGDRGRLNSGETMQLPLDIVRVRIDGGEPTWFVAHLVARGPWWHGRFVVVLNAQWLGRWKAGPRAHPNDAVLDVIDGSLGWRQRLQAARRARHGTHLPHPCLESRRVGQEAIQFTRRRKLWLDGQRCGWAHQIELVVEPDAALGVV